MGLTFSADHIFIFKVTFWRSWWHYLRSRFTFFFILVTLFVIEIKIFYFSVGFFQDQSYFYDYDHDFSQSLFLIMELFFMIEDDFLDSTFNFYHFRSSPLKFLPIGSLSFSQSSFKRFLDRTLNTNTPNSHTPSSKPLPLHPHSPQTHPHLNSIANSLT